jgi:hypothetical protein
VTEGDLTFEKLEINKRLMAVETNVALLTLAIGELKNSKNEVHTHILEQLKSLTHKLYGEGADEGIIIKVNDLWKESQSRTKHLMVVYTILAGMLIHTVWRNYIVNVELSAIHKIEKVND